MRSPPQSMCAMWSFSPPICGKPVSCRYTRVTRIAPMADTMKISRFRGASASRIRLVRFGLMSSFVGWTGGREDRPASVGRLRGRSACGSRGSLRCGSPRPASSRLPLPGIVVLRGGADVSSDAELTGSWTPPLRRSAEFRCGTANLTRTSRSTSAAEVAGISIHAREIQIQSDQRARGAAPACHGRPRDPGRITSAAEVGEPVPMRKWCLMKSIGGPPGTRTLHLRIKSPLLYLMS